MAFDPTTWVDGSHGGTPITAVELNRIEQGIVGATETADAAYVLPGTGIPGSQLATAVQTSLDKADTAYQAPAVVGAGTDQATALAAIGGQSDLSVLVATNYGVTTASVDIGPSLQTLLNTAASTGKRVFIPKGTYALATSVGIPANTHLYGELGSKIRLANSFPSSAPIYNAVTSGFTNVYIHDLEIDGNAAGQSGDQTVNGNPNIMMFLSSASGTPGSNIVVERVYAHDSYRLGIAFQNIDGGAVRDCVVGPNGRDGITIYGCKKIQVRGNRVSGCGDDMIGINSDTRLCEDVVVEGNILIGPSTRNVGKGIRVLGGRNIAVANNIIESPCEVGIYVATWDVYGVSKLAVTGNMISGSGTGGSAAKNGILVHANNAAYHASNYAYIRDVIIANNVVASALGDGITLRSDHTVADEMARIKVSGNIVSGCAGEGISVAYTTNCPVYDVQIENNDCYNNAGHGIWAVSAKRLKISGNICHDNGTGGTNTRGIRAETCDIVSVSGNVAYESRAGGSRTQTVGVQVSSPTTSVVVGSNLAYNHSGGDISYASFPGASTSEGWHGKLTGQLTVTGSRGGNAALASLLTQLAAKGVIVDGTSA